METQRGKNRMEIDWHGDIVLNCEFIYTSDEKLRFWGYGEWVEEADRVAFTHKGISCVLLREEPRKDNGGCWNAFIELPFNHPWAQKEGDLLGCRAHEEFLFKLKVEGQLMVGISFSGPDDLVPESLFKSRWSITYTCFLSRTYRNITHCVEKCCQIINEAHYRQYIT